MTKQFNQNSVFVDNSGVVQFYNPKDQNYQVVHNKNFTEIQELGGFPGDEEREIKDRYVLHENMEKLNQCLGL